jgi:hypothetical protein
LSLLPTSRGGEETQTSKPLPKRTTVISRQIAA